MIKQKDKNILEEKDFTCPREWLRYLKLKKVPGAVFRLKGGVVMSNMDLSKLFEKD